jgi:hypothetical protein
MPSTWGHFPRYDSINMTYRGHIRNGVAVLDTPVALPEGTPVRVEVDRADAGFWNAKSVEELAREQDVKPVRGVDELRGDWPEEDSIDDFLGFVREVRR